MWVWLNTRRHCSRMIPAEFVSICHGPRFQQLLLWGSVRLSLDLLESYLPTSTLVLVSAFFLASPASKNLLNCHSSLILSTCLKHFNLPRLNFKDTWGWRSLNPHIMATLLLSILISNVSSSFSSVRVNTTLSYRTTELIALRHYTPSYSCSSWPPFPQHSQSQCPVSSRRCCTSSQNFRHNFSLTGIHTSQVDELFYLLHSLSSQQ